MKPEHPDYRKAAILTLVLVGKICINVAKVLAEPILPGQPQAKAPGNDEEEKVVELAQDVPVGSTVIPLTEPIENASMFIRLESTEHREVRKVVLVDGTLLHVDAPIMEAHPRGSRHRIFS